jgi:hypothetical protein
MEANMKRRMAMVSGLRCGLVYLGLAIFAHMQVGCACAYSSEQATFMEVRQIQVAHQAGMGLDVEAVNGNVIVKKGGDAQVQIKAEFRCVTQERLAMLRVTADRRADGTLVVRSEWPEGRRSSEGCAFIIIIPDAKGVKLASTNGGIIVEGLAGEAYLRTSNGGIDVIRHDGSIDAETKNGGIAVIGAAHPLQLQTSNGGIDVELTKAFAGELDLKTSNGAVVIKGGQTMKYIDRKNTAARATINGGTTVSRMRTSNGGIVVTVGN